MGNADLRERFRVRQLNFGGFRFPTLFVQAHGFVVCRYSICFHKSPPDYWIPLEESG
jgi:hypothetical protein